MVREHDKRFKKLFENHHLVEHLLRSFVGLKFVDDLDFSKMVSVDKSFIDEKFKEKESDKIYRIRYKEKEIFIYLLMEFQSTVDKTMPLRFLRYLLELTETYGKEKSSGLFPTVFPLLIYNGEAKWTAKIEVSELFDNKIPKEFIPRFKYFPIIINKIPMKTLLGIHNAVSAVFLVENSSLAEYHEYIEKAVELIKEALPDEIKSFVLWFNSKLGEKDVALSDKQLEQINEPKEVMSMFSTVLDQIEEQGMQKGLQKGLQKTALNMIKLGSDLAFVAKVTGFTEEELKKMAKADLSD